MRRASYFALCLATIGLSACATVGSFGSGFSDYRSYVESRVQSERLFDHGKQLFSVKAILADAPLHAEQEKVAPGYGFRLDPAHVQVVVAVTSFGRRTPNAYDFQAKLNGKAPLSTEEVTSSSVVERLYPYAHPFYRVFLMDFDRGATSTAPELEILSPWGRMTLKLESGT